MNDSIIKLTPSEISSSIAQRMKSKRKKMKLTQSSLAEKSNVSLASIKRFEREHEISLISLIKIAIILKSESEFENLFKTPYYTSIDEVINE